MTSKYQSDNKKAKKISSGPVEKIHEACAKVEGPSTLPLPREISKEEFLRRLAAQGEPTEESESILAASSMMRNKRKADEVEDGLKAKIIIISLLDPKEKEEYGVCAFICGNMYPNREAIKKCNIEEVMVNGATIPMVADCLKAKFVSLSLLKHHVRHITSDCKELGTYFANMEACWMLYAPYKGGDKFNGIAAVDTGVPLYEYAKAWQRALSGQPLHYQSVDVVSYFVGLKELRAIDALYFTQDPNFGQRRSVIRL